jgi:hypothetical protein
VVFILDEMKIFRYIFGDLQRRLTYGLKDYIVGKRYKQERSNSIKMQSLNHTVRMHTWISEEQDKTLG